MADTKDTLTENDINNVAKAKTDFEKILADAKQLDETSKAYKDLVAFVGKKPQSIAEFVAKKKEHVSKTSRNAPVFTAAKKDANDILAAAKKAFNAIKAAKEKTTREALSEANVAALNQARTNLDKYVASCKLDGEKTEFYKSLMKAIADCGDIPAQIAVCKANIGKIPKTSQEFVKINSSLMKLVPLAKKTLADITANKTNTLTENDLKNLEKSHADFEKLFADAKKLDVNAKEYKDFTAFVAKKPEAIEAFLAAKKSHIGITNRNAPAYLSVKKDSAELLNAARKAINAIKASKDKAQKDALTQAHVNALVQANANLDKLVAACKKDGEESYHYKTLLGSIKSAGDIAGKIAFCKANVGKVSKTTKEFVNTNSSLMGLVSHAKKALAAIVAESKKPWTVTCHAAVTKAANEKSCKSLPRVIEEIKKLGLAAGGLRHIVSDVYDVKCSSSGDDRWVGIADPEKKTFDFKAHYDHGKNGKVFKAGEVVSGY